MATADLAQNALVISAVGLSSGGITKMAASSTLPRVALVSAAGLKGTNMIS